MLRRRNRILKMTTACIQALREIIMQQRIDARKAKEAA